MSWSIFERQPVKLYNNILRKNRFQYKFNNLILSDIKRHVNRYNIQIKTIHDVAEFSHTPKAQEVIINKCSYDHSPPSIKYFKNSAIRTNLPLIRSYVG